MSHTLNKLNITSEGLEELLPYIPSNCGYIINGKKYYGNGNLQDSGKTVKMLTQNNSLMLWTRRGFTEMELDPEDTELGVFTEKKRRRLITSRSMRPCPSELENNGLCHERFDHEHQKYFYHFAKYNSNVVATNKTDSRVQCKYSRHGKWHCWEKNNGDHAKIFFHDDDHKVVPSVPVWGNAQ